MGKYTFGKHERLSKETWIEELFEKGSSFYFHPFKVIHLPHPDPANFPTQVLFTVPKRQFHRAVDRNKIKRQLREAWRLHKSLLDTTPGKWLIAYIYTAKTILPRETFQQKIQGSIQKIGSRYDQEK